MRFFNPTADEPLHTSTANDKDVLAGYPSSGEMRDQLPETLVGRRQRLLVTAINERSRLLGEIHAGRLWALGIRRPPGGSDEIVRVPREHFLFVDGVGPDIVINWDSNRVTADRTTYFEVRVVRVPLSPARSLRSASGRERRALKAKASADKSIRIAKRLKDRRKANRPKKVGGRRNTSREIQRVFRKLLSERPELQNCLIKRLVGEVRAAILGKDRRNEEVPGYKSSSMAKIIGHELRGYRKRNKRNKPKQF